MVQTMEVQTIGIPGMHGGLRSAGSSWVRGVVPPETPTHPQWVKTLSTDVHPCH